MNSNHLLDTIGDAKDEYILSAVKTRYLKPRRHSLNKALLIAIAATLILVTMTGAVVYTRWSRSANADFHTSQEQREMAEDMRLSSMLEKESKPEAPISSTSQGIKVTAVQTIVDAYRAQITYRIEGFELPNGAAPATIGGTLTIDGQPRDSFISSWDARFYDGTMIGNDFMAVYSDGSPLRHDENGNIILYYVAKDGSMEYTERMNFREPGNHLGKKVVAHFSSFGYSLGNAENDLEIEGDWNLEWTLTGTDKTYIAKINAPIGDTGHTLLECEVTPLTIRYKLKTNGYYEGWDELVSFPNRVIGVRMKDGTVRLNVMSGMEGYENETDLIAVLEVEAMEILDVDKVEALLFFKDCHVDEKGNETDVTYYEVPIR